MLLVVSMLYAVIAELMGMHFVLGAFVAGLFDHPAPAGPIVDNLFSAIVIVAVITTLAMPILLRLTLAKRGHHL